MVSLPEHTPLQQLVDNTELNEKLANVATGPMKFFTIDTKSTEVPGVTSELDGYAIFPPGFVEDAAEPAFSSQAP